MAEPPRGIRVVASLYAPPGTAHLVDAAQLARALDLGIARSFMAPERVMRGPSPVEREFRRLRRGLARSCPLTAPPEWADLDDLDPPLSPLAWRATFGALATPPVRIIDLEV